MRGRNPYDPEFELIVPGPAESFRWFVHSYPHELAKWNYHPEYELHLIQASTGKMLVGDYIGGFVPGNLVLTGPNLPHNWVSDIRPGEVVRDRDMLVQFSDDFVRGAIRAFPEFAEIEPMLDDARFGIEFDGRPARVAAAMLRRIGQARGARRVLLLFEMLCLLARSRERRLLSSPSYAPTLNQETSTTINRALGHMIENMGREIRLSEVARLCGMSATVFSRFFKKNTGHGFVKYLNRLRIGRACDLLSRTDVPITQICYEVGFNNISNFNRQFRRVCSVTPTQYRSEAKRGMRPSTELFGPEAGLVGDAAAGAIARPASARPQLPLT